MGEMRKKRVDAEYIRQILPVREPQTHKGDYGKILLICGSRGYTGAAALAAMGALRSGAGVVYLMVPESIYGIEAVKLWESVVIPAADENGMLAEKASETILEYLQKMDAVLIGPGLGQSEGTFRAVKTVLEHYSGPVVVDADGINVLSEHKDILRDRTAPTILTPHMGEFARLGGNTEDDPVQAAAELSCELGCILLLKGHRTVITDGERYFVNETGNPGMATGGSGDVLAGIIVSLLGQGVEPLDAAACGAYLHGASGDMAAERIGQYGMLPTDMLSFLPRLLP